jgi:predicted dehydrogenase
MGTVHARNALGLDRVRLAAVASTRADRAVEVAAELGVRGCSYEELFAADDVDAVVVAARSIDHARVACAALEAGKHVFLEKPGATTLADHDLLVAAAADRPNQIVQLGYHRRFDEGFAEAARRVAAGAIGEPLLVLSISRDVRTPEPEDPIPAGGFLVDMASHDYDLSCWMLAQEPTAVCATRQTHVFPELERLGDVDSAIVVVRFGGGGMATIHVSRTCPWGHDVRAEVVGTEGSVMIGTDVSRPGVHTVTAADAPGFPVDYRGLFRDAYVNELQAFVDACLELGPRGPDLRDDRRAVAVGVAARAAAVSGGTHDVGFDWPWNCSAASAA